MEALLDQVLQHQNELERLGIVSLIVFVVTLIGLPIVVIYLPEDYFVRHRREKATQSQRHPLVWLGLTALKNVLGLVFVLAGIAMLVLPGQGLLTMLIGLALMNFPGKYQLEQRLVRQSTLRATLDKIRAVAGKPALEIEGDS